MEARRSQRRTDDKQCRMAGADVLQKTKALQSFTRRPRMEGVSERLKTKEQRTSACFQALLHAEID
jgi:hypothetical protein